MYALLFISLLVILPGCTVDINSEASNKGNDKNTETLVVDYLGREVAVPTKVNRIATLYAFTGHVVTMLGEGDKIVAGVNGLLRDNLLSEINPSIRNISVPYQSNKVNIEELAKTNPDLIFIQASTAQDEGERRKLEELNIPYLVVNFNSIKQQQQSIEMIGKALGKAKEAEVYNQFYNEMITLVSERIKDIPEEDRVRVYHSVNEATRTEPTDSLSAEWLKIAGARNVVEGENLKLIDKKYIANLEQILFWDPEVIIVNQDGVGDYILEGSQWKTIKAVKNKKVFQLPNGVSRWGHPGGMETPLAILWTAKTLYPDKFRDIDMEEVTANFYNDFFDYELTPELIEKVLSGKDMRIPKGDNK